MDAQRYMGDKGHVKMGQRLDPCLLQAKGYPGLLAARNQERGKRGFFSRAFCESGAL